MAQTYKFAQKLATVASLTDSNLYSLTYCPVH